MPPFPFDPPPGINSDDTTFSARGRWASASGFRFYQGKAETIGGADQATSTAFGAPNKMLAYKVSGTVNVAVAGTLLSRITPSDAGTATSTNITPAAGWDASSRHCLAMWGDDLLASCSGGKLFTSSSGAQATEITQSPDAITCMIVTPTRQVMALGCNEEGSGTFNGRCIRFSDIEDNTDWTTSATNNAGEYILPGQANIVSGTVLGDYVVVWTEGALWLGQFLGDPAQPWSFTRIADVGICGLDAFAVTHETVYWVSPAKGFHAYSVGGQVTEIQCPVSRRFQNGTTAAGLASIFGFQNRRFNEVWFFHSSSGDAYADNFTAFSVGESQAAQRPVWFFGTVTVLVSLGPTLLGAVIDDPILLTASGTNKTSVLGAARSTGGPNEELFWLDNTAGSTLGSFITSADQYFDEGQRRVMVRRLTPDFEYQTGDITLDVVTRDRPRSTETNNQNTVTAASTKVDFRVSGRLFAVSLLSVSTPLRLGKPVFDIVPLGER